MNYFSVDYLIVYAFLAITLIIGWHAGKCIKNIREYAIANKSFGTTALAFSLLAANIAGASVINGIARVFSEGIIMTVALLAVSVSFIISGLFISPKVAQFDDCLTMGDLTKKFYGPTSGIIAGGLGLLNAILLASMEFKILGIMCESLLGIPAVWGIIAGGVFIAIYTSYGGIMSVTMTDIFQFIMLAVCIPLIAYILIGKIGGIPTLLQQVPSQRLAIVNHPNFSFYLTLFLIWIIPAGMIDPAIIQRWLMAKRGTQLRNINFVAAAFDPVFRIVIMLIGLSAIVLYPQLDKKQVLSHLIYELLPVGIKGLCIVGILSVGISSISSYLHAAGLTLTHDVIKPIADRSKKSINEVKWARLMTILIGGIGIYIGLETHDVLGLAFNALEFVSPILFFPLISGIMGLKTNKESFYTGSVATLLAFVLAKLFIPKNHEHFSVLITMGTNGIVFFGMHFYINKALVIRNTQGQETILTFYKKDANNVFKFLIPTPVRIIAYSQQRVATYGAPYILFGTFLLINYTLPYFIWTPTLPQFSTIMLYFRLIGGILCVLLMAKEKWAIWLLPYFPIFWHFTVMYCLPFISTMMLLFTGANVEWVVNIFAIIILLFVLLDWLTAIIVGILGLSLGFIFYKLFIGSFFITLSFTEKYLMVYQGIFGILIGLIFARRRERHYDKLTTDNQTLKLVNEEHKEALLNNFKEKVRLLKTLKKAKVEDLIKAANLVKALTQAQNKSIVTTTAIKELDTILTPMAMGLERIESRATDYLQLEISPVNIDPLLGAANAYVPELRVKNNSNCKEIICDVKCIEKVFTNSIEIFQSFLEEESAIYLTLADTYLSYPLLKVKRDGSYVKKVPAISFSLSISANTPETESNYQAQMRRGNLPTSTSRIALILVENKRIIKAHYGYTNIDISKPNHSLHQYVVPVRVSEVRPRDMDSPDMELGADLVRADDTSPGAQEQEKAFLALVQQKTNANLAAIQTAIEMIKLYHGSVKRKSGEPFYLHPLAVAQIVLDYNREEATIIGALLHDVVEDTAMLLENIELGFGREVAAIVDGVTHFESLEDSFYKIQLSNEENILMLLELQETRALYVKIADRMHNMRTIEGHNSYAKKKQIAEETLHFFVPLAQKLGLDEAAQELKERSMQVINQKN